MGKRTGPRHGSLQFWPRTRAEKALPSVNWNALSGRIEKPGQLLGFICYKAGMMSAYVKDMTPNSMTKNKRIVVPCTLIECPTLKILSVRLYKNNLAVRDILNDNIDKELRKKIRIARQMKTKAIEKIEKMEKERASDYDDVRVVVYSQVKKTSVKKSPDIAELGISGKNAEEKLRFVKENLAKEIPVAEVFKAGLIDARGITKGKGTQGPVRRFGITLRSHKAEKGRRKPGSIGPWHPARLSFRIPFAGQLGFLNRVVYNSTIIAAGKISERDINPAGGFKRYGRIKSDYLILQGSVQGAAKRQLLITPALRPTKKQLKEQYELEELR